MEINKQEQLQEMLNKVFEGTIKLNNPLQLEKLEIAKKAFSEDKELRHLDFISDLIILDLDSIDSDLDKTEKQMYSILSYGVLSDRFTKLSNLSNEEIIPISLATMYVDADDYTFYAGILTDPSVSKKIVDSEQDLNKRVELVYSILESQQDYYGEDITPDNYDFFVSEAISIINENTMSR